jgi:hypothetical protein
VVGDQFVALALMISFKLRMDLNLSILDLKQLPRILQFLLRSLVFLPYLILLNFRLLDSGFVGFLLLAQILDFSLEIRHDVIFFRNHRSYSVFILLKLGVLVSRHFVVLLDLSLLGIEPII